MLLVNRCHAAGFKSSLSLSGMKLLVCIDDESVVLTSFDADHLVLTYLTFSGLYAI